MKRRTYYGIAGVIAIVVVVALVWQFALKGTKIGFQISQFRSAE